MKRLKIIFAGGGTGGHLFPALAIADRLKEMIEPEVQADFRFIGTRKGLEYRMRDRLGYPLSLINVRGLSRAGITRNLLFPILLVMAMLKSMFIILTFRPAVVVGTGGYVMGPVLMAAIALYRKCVIQEQNSYPGLTTRKLAGKVDRVFLGFGAAKKYLSDLAEITETGNPIKKSIGNLAQNEAKEAFGFNDEDKIILILGGSQGASSINQNILDHFDSFPEDIKIIWQTGDLNYEEITAALGERLEKHCVFAFTDEIEKAYAAADLAVTRAGALTLAELEAAGLPAILIPYPYAAEDHQRKNADYFAENLAAVIVTDDELNSFDIPAAAVDLVTTGKSENMAQAMTGLRARHKKPAVDVIAEEILKLIDFEGGGD